MPVSKGAVTDAAHTVFLVEFLNVESHLPFLDELVVELVPSCETGELRAWEMGDGMEVQAVDGEGESVSDGRSDGDSQDG